MFNNIGSKIKAYASILCWVVIILSFLITTILFSFGGAFIIMGIVIFAAGIIAGFLSTFLLYGYGELIDKTASIEKILRLQINNSVLLSDSEKLNKLLLLCQQGIISQEEYRAAVVRITQK